MISHKSLQLRANSWNVPYHGEIESVIYLHFLSSRGYEEGEREFLYILKIKLAKRVAVALEEEEGSRWVELQSNIMHPTII